MATRLYASGKARGACEGEAEAVNIASGMAMTFGARAGRDTGALAWGVLGEVTHHGACMSSARSGLVRRVLASSEPGSCTARVKRARSSGVRTVHILSAEALPTISIQCSCHRLQGTTNSPISMPASRCPKSSSSSPSPSTPSSSLFSGFVKGSSFRLPSSKRFRRSIIALRSAADAEGSAWMSDAS